MVRMWERESTVIVDRDVRNCSGELEGKDKSFAHICPSDSERILE